MIVKKDILATKEDLLKMQMDMEKRFSDMEKRFNQLTIWIVSTFTALAGIVIAVFKL